MKRILFLAYGGKHWVGGLYYVKNVIYTLRQSDQFKKGWQVVVVTEPENKGLFDEFADSIIIRLNCKYYTAINRRLFHLWIIYKYKIDYIYPIAADCRLWGLPHPFFCWIKRHEVCWIPDFQHLHLKQYFREEDLKLRDTAYKYVADKGIKVVLSSNTAKKDFIYVYGASEKNIAVLPFVSAIEREVSELSEDYCTSVLKKYNIKTLDYAYIPNQFWQHKNHMTVLKMIYELKKKMMLQNCQFVFTGNLEDERNKEHIRTLLDYIEKTGISVQVSILGFINRSEQLAIMKKAKVVIQPSLFEGWGTVLEDCKILGKKVLLSDIPIHREQKDENCVLFDCINEKDLMYKTIKIFNEQDHDTDINKQIENARMRARKYSCDFINLLQ